ncbi:MAG: MarP family serine protease [Thermoleophilaceae bacterium]|nr:MarP family serine protease [Thermoleophilaceae bacterium]
MTTIDWIIVAFTALMAVWGFYQGLIIGVLSLGGFVAGAFAGSRLAPTLLEEGSKSPYAPLVALAGGLLLGGLLAMLFEALGAVLRARIGDALGVLDGMGGAVLMVAVGLALAWIGGSVALQTPGMQDLRREIQRSDVLAYLNERLPPSGPILNALARFDPFPAFKGPEADVPRPDSRAARGPAVRRARRSVVRVLGTACGLGVQGSGWVARPGIVVTNAHVVAGQDDTTVQVKGAGQRFNARAMHFDPRNDIAVLAVGSLPSVPALALKADARPGTSGAVLGFPNNGSFDREPVRLGETRTVRSSDAYGGGAVRRSVTTFRGNVRSGNSGGPVVDRQGRVVTTVFAAGTGAGTGTGYGVPDSVARSALADSSRGVSTGPCTR